MIDLPAIADPENALSQPTRARLFSLLGELKQPAETAQLAERLGLHPNGVRLHLERLEEAGLVEHPSKGQYRVVDEVTTPKPAWIEPVSGTHVARHAADGRVRDEMTIG